MLYPGYTYAQDFWALRDINLEVLKGQTLGIIGRNGSGKSTLLQIIAGTLTPTSGSVEVKGRIGALLELGSGFNPEFTGRENVFLNGAILGLTREEMEQRFDAIAAFADIGDFIDQPVQTYSSGMVVRLAFAVSVNIEPDILILDEALAVGDAAFQFKCFERLERLTKLGVTILFVSHDIGAIKLFCEHVLYLAHGKERAYGATDKMAELYFLDLSAEQKQFLSNSSPIQLKQSLQETKGIAYGTDEGQILSAKFTDTEGSHTVFTVGERIEFEVEIEYNNSIKYPCLSLNVINHKSINVGGELFRISTRNKGDGIYKSTVSCSFIANLTEGSYFLTIKLEDRKSDTSFFIIDRQPNILSFDILTSSKKTFLGWFNLQMECVEKSVTTIK
jgi:lipopolysaccharide transport system ATP-binding protein